MARIGSSNSRLSSEFARVISWELLVGKANILVILLASQLNKSCSKKLLSALAVKSTRIAMLS